MSRGAGTWTDRDLGPDDGRCAWRAFGTTWQATRHETVTVPVR